MKALTLAVLLLGAFVLMAPAVDAQQRKFKTNLSGDEEVPPVDTTTTGKFKIKFNSTDTEAKFKLTVKRGVEITQAHLHCNEAGENGPIVVFLFGMVPGGFDVNGKLAKFTLTDENITARGTGVDCEPIIGFPITNLSELRQAIEDGDIYVNVHSVDNPGGEVRGQLQ